jgi:hypothetical protein
MTRTGEPPCGGGETQARHDVAGLLAGRCRQLIAVPVVAVWLAATDGGLRTAAIIAQPVDLADLISEQGAVSACAEAFRSEAPVVESDITSQPHHPLGTAASRFPLGTAAAVPMQADGSTLGVLGLFSDRPHALSVRDVAVAHALADVSGLVVFQQRRAQAAEVLTNQLQTALNSRVVIEQAKGMLAQRTGADVQAAFEAIRAYVRSNRVKLTSTCQQIVDGTIDQTGIIALLYRGRAMPSRRQVPDHSTTGYLA